MSATEIAIYAVETKAIIQILWGLLLITVMTLVSVSIMYGLLRVKQGSAKRREGQFARHLAAKATEIAALEARLAQQPVDSVDTKELKAEVRRATTIRAKAEDRLLEQNAELKALRTRTAEQAQEIAELRKLVEHAVDL